MVILKSVLFVLFLIVIVFNICRLVQTIKIRKNNEEIVLLILNIVLLFLIEYFLVKDKLYIDMGLILIYTLSNLILNRLSS